MTGLRTRLSDRASDRPFALGSDVVAEPRRNLVRRGDRTIRVEPRVMELLVYLARRPGQIVSKSELIEQLWKAHVVDEAVHRAVSLLRAALGDSAQQPAIVETVPRRGYRLMVRPSPLRRESRANGRWLLAGIAGALIVAAAWLYEPVGPTAPEEQRTVAPALAPPAPRAAPAEAPSTSAPPAVAPEAPASGR